MRKRSRALAVLLSLAMTLTSFSVPAMAEETVTEDIAVETVEESAAVDVVAEEDVTGIIGDMSKGDTFIEVHSLDELKTALAAAPSDKETTIKMMAPYSMDKDDDYTISGNYVLETNGNVILDMNRIAISFKEYVENADGTMTAIPKETTDAYTGAFNIGSGAKVTIKNAYSFNAAITNEGTLKVINGSFDTRRGVTLTNKGTAYLEGGTFSVDNKSYNKNSSTIINEGEMVINSAQIYSAGTMTLDELKASLKEAPTEEQIKALRNNESYTVNNSGTLLVENATINSGSGYGKAYAVLNTKSLDIRGDSSIASILNKGAEAVAVQGKENGTGSSVDAVYTIEDASYTLHNGNITTVSMTTDAKSGLPDGWNHYYDTEGTLVKAGNFTQVGGTVRNLYYSADLLPTLNVGYVGKAIVLEKKSDEKIGGARPDTFKFQTNEGGSLNTVDAFKQDAEKYKGAFEYTAPGAAEGAEPEKLDFVVAGYIYDGIPYIYIDGRYEPIVKVMVPSNIGKLEKITSLTELQAAAAKGGAYYLDITVKDEDGDYVYPKDSEENSIEAIEITAPITISKDFTLVSKEDGAEEYEELIIKGAGGFIVNADVVFENYVNLDASDNDKEKPQTASVIVNNGTVKNYGEIYSYYTSAPVIANAGKMINYAEIIAYYNSAAVISNSAEGVFENRNAINVYNSKSSVIDNAGTFIQYKYITYNNGRPEVRYYSFNHRPNRELNAEGESVAEKNLVTINNTGNFTAEANIYSYVESGIAVKNTGSYTMNAGSINMQNAKKSTAVSNDGSFILANGTIYAYGYNLSDVLRDDVKNSYAIVYANDNMPIILGGEVYGSRGTSYSDDKYYDEVKESETSSSKKYTGILDETNPAFGSAVIKADNTTGSFKNSQNVVVDSLNAGHVDGGFVIGKTDIQLNTDYTYMLMEVGESVLADDLSAEKIGEKYDNKYPFILNERDNTFGVEPSKLYDYTVIGTGVSVKPVKASVYDPETYNEENTRKDRNEVLYKDKDVTVISADGVGSAVVKVTDKLTGANEYINVDVVAKDGRAKIVAENYTAKLVDPKKTINAYSRKNDIEVYWELNTAVTGKYNIGNSFKPESVVVTGKSASVQDDITRYFVSTSGIALKKDVNSKRYKFTLDTQAIAGGQSTNLVQDGITKLEPLNVTLIVRNTASGKTLEVPLSNALEFTVNQTKPSVKLKKQTVNSAYTENAIYKARFFPYENLTDAEKLINPACIKRDQYNKTAVTAFGRFSINAVDSKDFNVLYDGTLQYVGSSKGGSYKVPVNITFNDGNGYGYYGNYDAVLPVTAKAVYPKVTVAKDEKTAVVPATAADYNNIPVCLESKDAAAVGTIKDIEIVGDSSFEVDLRGYNTRVVCRDGKTYASCNDNEKPGRTHFYLKPRKDLTKAEKVKLKVTYDNLKANKGKKYSSIVYVSVKPVDRSKFKINKPTASVLYPADLKEPVKNEAGEDMTIYTAQQATISFTTNPSSFTDGYFVAESVDGKTIVGNVEGSKEEYLKEKNNESYAHIDGSDIHGGSKSNGMSFNVSAASTLSKSDKTVSVKITWYDSKNNKLGKEAIVKVPVNWNDATVADLKPVTINTNKPLHLDTQLNDDTYKLMTAETSVKATNGAAFSDVVEGPDGLFDFVGSSKKDTVNMITVTPKPEALDAGLIMPGASYTYTLRFTTPRGENIDKKLEVKVADIKSAKVKAVKLDELPNGAEMSAAAGYSRTKIAFATEKPYYSLKVDKVELDAKSAAKFEIAREASNDFVEIAKTNEEAYKISKRTEQYYYGTPYYPYANEIFALTYKDNTVPGGLKAKEKVTLNITYANGAKAKVIIPVTIVGLGKAK